MTEKYIIAPGLQLEPGDVFDAIPFPNLKYPLEFFRQSQKRGIPGPVTRVDSGSPKPGDIPRSTFQLKLTMLLSHGCEVDRDLQYDSIEKRHWLGAPVEPLNTISEEMQTRTRERRQPNKFYVPPAVSGSREFFVDFRRITPITCKYFVDAKDSRQFSLSQEARDDLHAALSVFFSGRAFYLGTISCPHCDEVIDLREFEIASPNEPDADY